MARSQYIYVVTDQFGPLASFTVRRELVSWLKRQLTLVAGLRVFRLVDNGSPKHVPVELDLAELTT